MKRILSTVLLSSVILTGFPGIVLAEEINKPDMYKVSDTISYDVSAAISTTWPDHVNEDIVITNTGSNAINDWYLTFKVPCSIDDLWEASVFETDNNGTYSIKCADCNRTLQPGATVTVGLTLSSNEEGVNYIPEWYILSEGAPAYDLTSDVDANGNPDYLDFIGRGSSADVTPTPEGTPTDDTTVTDTPTVTDVPEVTNEPTVTDEPTVTPVITEAPEDEMSPSPVDDPQYYMRDRDGDGLLDYLEDMYMTDPDNKDTDGDGLLDGDEININTNPRVGDTDGNGISDYEEDFDGDGIHNGGEYATGTCMFAYDSDYDGVNDHDEIYLYGIDPRNEDSDSDGIKDGDEMTLGLNPGSNDSDSDGITDDLVTFDQSLSMSPIEDDHPHEITSVKISGNISGLITSNTKIEDTYNSDFYCTDVYGRVGVPINIESEGHFESMTLTIGYDESLLGDTDESKLGVLWYDEESGFFVEQEQAVVDTENNTITLTLNHFSSYVLVDLDKWNNPILPEDTNYIFEATSGGGYIANSYLPTVEEEEGSSWNLWTFTQRQMIKLATINATCTHESGCVYTFMFTWLVMDPTDNDNDGLPDAMEYTGMLGSNRRIYYSSPESEDGDGDGLKDSEELGVVYTISRCSDGKHVYIRLDNEIVYESTTGTIEEDSQYYVLMDRFNMVKPGRTLSFCVPYSDARKIDSDDDGCNDAEDARPLVENEDCIYIFTTSCLYDQANKAAALYSANGYKSIITCVFHDSDSFKEQWDGIGLSLHYYHDSFLFPKRKPYGDRYYFNVKNVVILSHGDLEGRYIVLGEDDILATNYVENVASENTLLIKDLSDKHIESLNLYSCWTGAHVGNFNSVAEMFMYYKQDIKQVIAPDTMLIIYTKPSSPGFWLYCISYRTTKSASQDEYTQFENNSYNGQCVKIYNYESYLNCEGFLAFMRNDDGSIDIHNIYEDDVVIGDLYVLSEPNGEGYIVYDYRLEDAPYHDPIVE